MQVTHPAHRKTPAIVAALLGGLVITGCSSFHHGSDVHAISSAPPIKAIELLSPATVNDEGKITAFPAGKYKAVYEDDRGFYFEAPSKVMVDDIAVYAYQGGVYLERGKTAPTGWYFIHPNGQRTTGHFRHPPLVKIVS
jgi:hypothetical protein